MNDLWSDRKTSYTIIKRYDDHSGVLYNLMEDIQCLKEQLEEQRQHDKQLVIDAVRTAVRDYGTNSVTYIHTGDDDIKVIKAIKEALKVK